MSTAPFLWAGGWLATELADVTDDPAALDSAGWWAVVQTFEGGLTCARFQRVRRAALPRPVAAWRGSGQEPWGSSLDRAAYIAAVDEVRDAIAAGEVYQACLCRVLTAVRPVPPDPLGLAAALTHAHPAPYAAVVHLPSVGVHVVSASPELFLHRRGAVVESAPIKGTARTAEELRVKDVAENVMIVDLVRNDLSRVAETGAVDVPELCAREAHPGLVHLVSTVRARLRPAVGWAELLTAAAPPGSVSGAPKHSALQLLRRLEPAPRGPYCGAVGWVDADHGTGALAVGIRTFWWSGRRLRFGSGAGITWDSDPDAEWAETELKAERLLPLASHPAGQPSGPSNISSASSASMST